MHLGRPFLQFANWPTSTDEHIIFTYIHYQRWRNHKDHLAQHSHFTDLENWVLEKLGNLSKATGPTILTGIRTRVFGPLLFHHTTYLMCTHVSTQWDVCSHTHTVQSTSWGESKRLDSSPSSAVKLLCELGPAVDSWLQFLSINDYPSSYAEL